MPQANTAGAIWSTSSIVGLAVLAGAIVLGIALFVAARRRGRAGLGYAVRGIEMVSPHIGYFGTVHLNGRAAPVTTLTLSEVLVWNAARDPIGGEGAARFAITVEAPAPSEIYSLRLGPSDTKDAQTPAMLTGDAPVLSFATLRPNEGFVVQVLHGGHDPAAVRLNTADAGAAGPTRSLPPYMPWAARQVRLYLLIGTGILAIILMKSHVLHPLYVLCLIALFFLFGGGVLAAVVGRIERWRLSRRSPALRYFCNRDTITLKAAPPAR